MPFVPTMRFGSIGRSLLPLLLVGALAGCTSVGSTGAPEAALVADASPVQPLQPASGAAVPQQHDQIVAQYGGVYRDPELERTLARIVGRLVAASDDPSRSYTITILNASAVNAFALPEGYLYVTRGLLALATDSSEVAAVLAHEMAHVTANHAAQRQNQALSAAIVNNVVTQNVDATDAQVAVQMSQRTLAGFSQQQELEADAIGIRTVARAGYDPYAASRFLLAMSSFDTYRAALGFQQNQQPDFLASHPSNPERIALAVQNAAQYGVPGAGEVDRDRYLSGLDGTVFGDDTAQGFIRGRNFYHPGLAIGFGVPEGWVLDNTQPAVLGMGTDGTALRFDAVTLASGQDLTAYLSSGWVNGLDTGSIQLTTINGLPAVSANAAAGGWQFRITVVQVDSAAYRFIFANNTAAPSFIAAAASIPQSFRRLTAQEVATVGPLKVRVVTVGANDTMQTMAQRMVGVDNPVQLFEVLNGFDDSTVLTPGSQVKIVGD